MKVEVNISRKAIVEVADPVFEALRNIHASNPCANGTDEQYNEAVRIIEKALGIPVETPATPGGEYIWGVYALDDDNTAIFEL